MEYLFSNKKKQPTFKCLHCRKIQSHSWKFIDNSLGPKIEMLLAGTFSGDSDPSSFPSEVREKFNDPKKIAYIVKCECNYCDKVSIWLKFEDYHEVQIYPQIFDYPEPHAEMPDEVSQIYNQAGKILIISPSASAALSRLALEKLLTIEGFTQNSLNDKIGAIIKANKLNSETEKHLDIIRHYGNKGVHTGTIDLDDEDGISQYVLGAINSVVDDLIAKPNKTNEMFDNLPESIKKAIEKRDAPN